MPISKRLPFSISKIVTIAVLLTLDALIATFIIAGASFIQIILYILANGFFAVWLVITWRRKTAVAIGMILTGITIAGLAAGLDYLAVALFTLSEAESWMTLASRLGFIALATISVVFIISRLTAQRRKVQRVLWAFSFVGIGLHISLIQFPAQSYLSLFWFPLGLSLIFLGTVFQLHKTAGKLCVLAIWVFILVEIVGTLIGMGFPTLSAPLKALIASVPAYIYITLYLPALYFFWPMIWKVIWSARDRVRNGWELFSESLMGKAGLVIVLVIALMGVFAPYLAPYPYDQWSDQRNSPPSVEHPLGTNNFGQDLLSRIIWGSQISLIVGFAAAAISVVVGTLVGVVSGYYGGAPDSLLMRITDLFLSIPTLPLMLIFAVLFGKALLNIILALSILGWTGTARMVRSQTLSLKERPITEAAKAIGASDTHIVGYHILPNVLPLILANMVLGIVNAVLGEAGLSFLGFGVPFGPPSWGIILYWARIRGALLNNYWWWIITPGLLIMLIVLGFAFLSHALDQVLNPRLRGRKR
jgi:peptide/nickel transport system permease protein